MGKWPRKIPSDEKREVDFSLNDRTIELAADSTRSCLAGHPVQSGGRAQCNIKNERRPRRFISHFHFLITVSAYRRPACPPFLSASSPAAPSSWRRALGSSFSFRIAPSRALPLSLLSLSLYPVITSPIAFIDLPITVLSRYNGVAASGLDCHVRLRPATYMSEQERSPRGTAAVAAAAAAVDRKDDFPSSSNNSPVPHGFVSSI